MASSEFSVRIDIEEPSGLPRTDEPVTIGVPFPRALLMEPTALAVMTPPVIQWHIKQGRSADGQTVAQNGFY